MSKKKHGMTGKRNALKKDAEKTSVERVSLFVPSGWKDRAKKRAQDEGLSLNKWIRKQCDL